MQSSGLLPFLIDLNVPAGHGTYLDDVDPSGQ